MNITVLGAGAWGTALSLVLHEQKHEVTLWGHNAHHLEEMRKQRSNHRYLPGVSLPAKFSYELDAQKAIGNAEMVIVAIPSRVFREATKWLAQFQGIAVSVTKGIEHDTGLTMAGILKQNAPKARVGVLSGPSLALEVAHGVPTAIVGASDSHEIAAKIQSTFHRPAFRVYTTIDMLGVELGGALKNVIAIAAGVCDGLGFGDNSKAALLTRAIVEIRRLGEACGANPETFAGLSGLGDLTVTCFSRLSRNRTLGERLGKGEQLHDVLVQSVSVAEGYPTARSAFALAQKLNISAPIIEEVYAMLYQNKNVAQAVTDLISRESKPE